VWRILSRLSSMTSKWRCPCRVSMGKKFKTNKKHGQCVKGEVKTWPHSATEVGEPQQVFLVSGSETHQESKMLESKFSSFWMWENAVMDNKKICYYFLSGVLLEFVLLSLAVKCRLPFPGRSKILWHQQLKHLIHLNGAGFFADTVHVSF
jgi:hypothetical protein